jgi:carboxymethylenebutenolidase
MDPWVLRIKRRSASRHPVTGWAILAIRNSVRGDTTMASLTIQASDGSGSFSAYLVEPNAKPAGVVVLIQEIFGVNQAMRDIAAWVADIGFIALCPDLFWRIEPGIDITDKTEAEWKRAFELFNRFDQAKGIEDLKATVAASRKLPGANGRVGTMGYCLGGRLAFMMAEQSDADVNISYYGVGLDNLLGDIGNVRKPLLIHIADKDEFFPPEGRAKVVEAVKGHKQIAAYVYPDADHAFARVGGTHWHGRSAAMANGRSAEALVSALG